MRICIPTNTNEGQNAHVSSHFGSAEYFTIYDTDKDDFKIVDNTNTHHSHGMCHPLNALDSSNIDIIVCGGMGARAVMKLNDGGIKAYRASGNTVADIIQAYNNNDLEEITPENACGNHSCDTT